LDGIGGLTRSSAVGFEPTGETSGHCMPTNSTFHRRRLSGAGATARS
jgi:hypothetical protein